MGSTVKLSIYSKLILGQMVTPQRSCSRAWFESGEDLGSTETYANVAQSVERKPFKLVAVGSSPTVGTWPFGLVV